MPPAKLKLGAWWAVHCRSSATLRRWTRAIARRQVHRRYLLHPARTRRGSLWRAEKISPHGETTSAANKAHGC